MAGSQGMNSGKHYHGDIDLLKVPKKPVLWAR